MRAARLAQELLDDAVLKTVERDHRKPPARCQQALACGKPGDQFVEFAVDVNPDRLKAARCRVLGRTGVIAERLADDAGEFAGGGQRPRGDNRAGDAA